MKDVHKQFVEYGANAKKWIHKCALLLPEIAEKKIWKKKGYGSIYEYAAKLAGMSKHAVDNSLWVMRKIQDKPALKRVAEEKGVNRVRPVANIVTEETQEFWAKKASTMTKNTLEAFTKSFCPRAKTQPAKVQISMELDPEIADKLQKLKGNKDWNEFMKEFLKPKEEKPKPVKTESHHIPNKIQKYIRARSGNRCEYPGCKRKAEIFHHTERFALHKCHDPDKIRHLCEGHERLAHKGLIENEEKSPEFWEIREEPDRADPKFKIDQLVISHRYV